MKYSIKDFKHELRMNLSSDHWGYSMSTFFEICDHLTVRNEDTPHNWGFKIGLGGCYVDEDSSFKWMFEKMTTDQLIQVGELLNRYTQFLRFKELDY